MNPQDERGPGDDDQVAPAPGGDSLSRAFDEVARARPRDLAVVSSRGACTFGELHCRVDALARALVAVGVGRGVPVGVAVPRSLESMVAALGILRAGAPYVPIDPGYPVQRQQQMAADSGIGALVVDSRLAPLTAGVGAPAILDLSATDLLSPPPAPIGADDLPHPSGDDLLYILYTSGSTGRPKGVCGTHAATMNRLRWGWRAMPFAGAEVVGHRSSLVFVDAAPEMFSGLLRGIPTAVVLPDEVADLGRFVDALRRHQVTRLTVVPSILAALLRAQPDLGRALSRLRTWITSGEELPMPLLAAFRAALPDALLVNLYGTTEVTGDVTCMMFAPGEPLPQGGVPIGTAMADAELLVLDPQGNPVADGEAGELYVGGPVLARGYHDRPGEEAVRFPRHPQRPGARVFRTGDLVRRRSDGVVFYLGRMDNLVKVRGVRIELEEVERTLRAGAGIEAALGEIAVVLAGDALVAFVTPQDADLDALRDTARRLLPAAMVPSRFIALSALPLLPNGKCDRRTLAAQVRSATRDIAGDRRPSTPTERRVAALWATLLRRDDIAKDDSFASLGGDSLGLAELLLTMENTPGMTRIDLGVARDGTLEDVARVLDGATALAEARTSSCGEVVLVPLADEAMHDDAIAMLVEGSADAALCAATELPAGMDTARARAYCLAHDGVVIRADGVPVGAGLLQHHPNIGTGVDVPAGAVQLDEWLLPRHRDRGILGEAGAWPLLAEWMARRFDHEVSVVWADHLAMLAILRARGYTRVGRSWWESTEGGDGTSGWCEVWIYDLRPHRRG
jgi:amino acid adenylation domain-containing protein